jgi:hypothetical protein
LKTLKKLFQLGNEVKSMPIEADRAHAAVIEGIAAEDWHAQRLLLLLVVVARLSLDTRKISKIRL